MSVLEILETLILGPLKLVFEVIFSFAQKFVGHPGLAIIALSLAMNILILPLYRQADAMQEKARDMENKLRDGINHIKKHFSGDERMMVLQTYYRQNHYSPLSALSGSVSLLLEIPFFMAAYQFLSNLQALEGISLGPIRDLSAPDALVVIGSISINLLPLLMTLVNVVSSALYLKGFPLKTKIQLYAMAAFFLVFLYNSPAGLLLYWTLNNVFSLVKTIFYKLKNPGKVLMLLSSMLGLCIWAYLIFADLSSGRLFLAAFGLLLQCPMILPFLRKKIVMRSEVQKFDSHLFLLGAVFLTVLTGLLIPSTFIAASPQEYVNSVYFYHPNWYAVYSLCMAAGTFLIWMGVFYWLANPSGKILFSRIVWAMCGVFLMNYMFFGTDLGNLSPSLQYTDSPDGLWFPSRTLLTNLCAILLLGGMLYFAAVKFPRKTVSFALVAVLATASMSLVNLYKVNADIQQVKVRDGEEMTANFQFSKTGKNVVVLMLDRALGEYIPYLFAEDPDLEKQFAGFTYYSNTVSFGPFTNFGVPPLMGGYEYTPVEMNKRSTELLKDKHNEALLVMPVMFDQAGFDVTVCDPPYANYQWIPDLSIFDPYPSIRAFNADGVFNDEVYIRESLQNRARSFFCFSIMKSMPLAVQGYLYDYGNYHRMQTRDVQITYTYPQSAESPHQSTGVVETFMSAHKTLSMLPHMTAISNDEINTYLFMSNNITHEPQLLQLPDYTIAQNVDNTAYASAYENGITLDGKTLKMETYTHVMHYHTNMAALKQIGQWLDYLRKNDVYDNTRIIIVSDHGRNIWQLEGYGIGNHSVEGYAPLLMVKDFDSKVFTTSDAFMTNADVPSLAAEGLIDNPVNPFTGNVISMTEKTAHDQFIIMSGKHKVFENNGTTFFESQWASVKDNIWEMENWTVYDDTVVLSEHAAP